MMMQPEFSLDIANVSVGGVGATSEGITLGFDMDRRRKSKN